MVEIDDQIELKNGECTTLRKLVNEDRVTIWHAPFYSSGGVSAPREAFFADIYLEPIQEEGIHAEWLGRVKRRNMMRIMARRKKAATVRA